MERLVEKVMQYFRSRKEPEIKVERVYCHDKEELQWLFCLPDEIMDKLDG